ncbi:MAG: sensor histidine kinase [Opitutales bacterium]
MGEAPVVLGPVRRPAPRLTLDLTTNGNFFTASIPGQWNNRDLPRQLRGARVRVQGVFGSLTAPNSRKLVGLRVYVPSMRFLEVVESGYDVAFLQPPKEVEDFLNYEAPEAGLVHVRGIISALGQDGSLYLRVGREQRPLAVQLLEPDSVSRYYPGQVVSAAGLPTLAGSAPVLELAAVRVIGEQAPPEPRPLPERAIDRAWHGELVTVEAQLIDRFSSDDQRLLLLSDGARTFPAIVRTQPGVELPEILPNSWIRLNGVCLVMQEPYNLPSEPWLQATTGDVRGFKLWVPQPGTIEVLREPPFWNTGRLLTALSAFGGLLVVSFIANALMRRKITAQTRLIEAKVERERVTEERDRIARELHDSLEQELAALGIQLDLARTCDPKQGCDQEATLETAQRLLRRTQAEARRSIQDLRDGLLDRASLREALQLFCHRLMAEFHHRFDVELDTLDFPVPASVAHNLLRVAQEALNNAIRHAGAEKTHLRLRQTGPEELEIVVRDEGPGFDINANFPGHFGLQGMRERARRIGGHLRIESEPGRGSSVILSWKNRTRPSQ